VVTQKIDTDDGELYIGEEECEGEAPATEGQRHRLLAPTLDWQAIGAEQLGAWRENWWTVRDDAVGGPSADKKTPVCEVIFDVDEIAGGDGVEVPPGNQFPCQLQGDS